MTATFILPSNALPHFELVQDLSPIETSPAVIHLSRSRRRRTPLHQKAAILGLIVGIKASLLAVFMLLLQEPETVLVVKPILIKSLSEELSKPDPITPPTVSIVTPQISLPEMPQINLAVAPTNAITLPQTTVAPAPPAPSQDNAVVSEEEALYYQRLQQLLNQANIYPRAAKLSKQQGVVEVAFIIAKDGTLVSSRVTHSSGFPVLDAAALTALRRVSPFPPIPASFTAQQLAMTLPIEYSLNM